MSCMIRILAICIAGAAMMAGCNLARTKLPVNTVEAGETRVRLQASPPPATATLGALIREVSERTATPAPTELSPSRCDELDVDRPARQVDADVLIDYEAKSARVVPALAFHNREAQP